MAKKRSAGLLVMTELPACGLVAVLQRRGVFNHEKMGPESFPGGCQLTAHGGVEDGETPFQTVRRELSEEMGSEFAGKIDGFLAHCKGMSELVCVATDEKEVYSYGVKAPADLLKTIRLGPSSGGIVLVTREQSLAIHNLKDYKKDIGVEQLNVIAMFPDERDAVLKAFEIFS